MEIITGYFISRGQALEAAKYLRDGGFEGKISVIGSQNREDEAGRRDGGYGLSDGISREAFAGSAVAATAGLSLLTVPGVGVPAVAPILIAEDLPLLGGVKHILAERGVPEGLWDEIQNVVQTGNSVMVVECRSEESSDIENRLRQKGAQNIHI